MDIILRRESGNREAIMGLSYSYNTSYERAEEMAKILSKRDDPGGENKFLEFISVWVDISAPRFWWQEFDTYRVGVSKQSESTMHTLLKKPLIKSNFEYPSVITDELLAYLNNQITAFNSKAEGAIDLPRIKSLLPEGFLQSRLVMMNYLSIRHIIKQRHDHKLPQWKFFCDYMKSHLVHKEYIDDL